MKSKILKAYPKSEFVTTKSEKLFVADFTKRTKNMRGVELFEEQPKTPSDSTKNMPCFVLNNSYKQSIDYSVFDAQQFIDEDGNSLKQGECCVFPTHNDGRSWFCIIEIKDCAANKVSQYKENIAEKMKSMFEIFRNKVGISNTIFFMASFPRKKADFDQSMFDDYVDMKKYRKAFLVASNSATIVDNHLFYPYN
jgi:hypothetical protein